MSILDTSFIPIEIRSDNNIRTLANALELALTHMYKLGASDSFN